MVLTQRSASGFTPGDTALRTMVGWNIRDYVHVLNSEIIYYALSESTTEKVMGIPEKWFWALAYTIFCVFVECLLNYGGHLVWEYPFWHRTFAECG
ncbi:MAG: hypothetical protein R2875_11700 [Desulfobacterales bacterium]